MSPSPVRSRLRRRVRRALGLGIVGALSFPLIAFSNAVEVEVDGDVLSTRTYATTVGDVLDELEVGVGPGDEVSHDPEVELGALDGDAISVERAFTVEVAINDAVVRRVTAPFGTVEEVLDAADLAEMAPLGTVDPPPWRSVGSGDRIDLELPRTVHLVADGEAQALTTDVTTVGELLDEAGITLGEHDEVDWELDARVVPHTSIRVARVAVSEEVEEVELPFEEIERETDQLDRGDTRVDEAGTPGLRRDTFQVTERDGEEVEREKVDSEVVEDPVDRVVLVGTRRPPPPPPPPSSSSSSSSSSSASSPSSSDAGVWDQLAQCESGGNWSINTGNGYYGGLQFHIDTWRRVGGSGYPHQASKAEQIRRAEILRGGGSYRPHWPSCSRQLGLP